MLLKSEKSHEIRKNINSSSREVRVNEVGSSISLSKKNLKIKIYNPVRKGRWTTLTVTNLFLTLIQSIIIFLDYFVINGVGKNKNNVLYNYVWSDYSFCHRRCQYIIYYRTVKGNFTPLSF